MDRFSPISQSESMHDLEVCCKSVTRQLSAGHPQGCPIEFTSAAIHMLHSRSCGKCTPCRVGLETLCALLTKAHGPEATLTDAGIVEETARVIVDTADCAIGVQAALLAIRCTQDFRDHFHFHVEHGRCTSSVQNEAPCVMECPGHINVPGYVALLVSGRPADAVRLIRRDNPLPLVCGLICEHPCETFCRRGFVDSPLSIKELKRVAVEQAGNVPLPPAGRATGKRVAVVGGGPAGITCACYLKLMGHDVVVFESLDSLGGMLHYGIPGYRLPKDLLEEEIAQIVDLGIDVRLNSPIVDVEEFERVASTHDAVYLAIGAQADKKLHIDNEDARGVVSAVEMLRRIAQGSSSNLTGQRVVVIGGGNVAMDAARSAVRLGAEHVSIVYRRRLEDMTALEDEILGAIAEGCEVIDLHAPLSIKVDKKGAVVGLVTAPQIIGRIEQGRAKPRKAAGEARMISCDLIVVAIGQAVESEPFEAAGIPAQWGQIEADAGGHVNGFPHVFSGGDCVTGPSTVIKAIAAGKAAARSIDFFLGFSHALDVDVEVPTRLSDDTPTARVKASERSAHERIHDFSLTSHRLTDEEALQEASRCLRCDRTGCGSIKTEGEFS